MIIQDIYRSGTSTIEFLHRHKKGQSVTKQIGPRVTSMDLVYIEESKEDEVMEQQFVEAQAMQKDAKEEDVIEAKMQPSTKVQTLT